MSLQVFRDLMGSRFLFVLLALCILTGIFFSGQDLSSGAAKYLTVFLWGAGVVVTLGLIALTIALISRFTRWRSIRVEIMNFVPTVAAYALISSVAYQVFDFNFIEQMSLGVLVTALVSMEMGVLLLQYFWPYVFIDYKYISSTLVPLEPSSAGEDVESLLASVDFWIGKKCFNTNDLLFIQTENQYVRLHKVDGQELLFGSLAQIEEQVPLSIGVRVHRSYLVFFSGLDTFDEDSAEVRLKNGQTIPISRRNMRKFRDTLNARNLIDEMERKSST